MDDTTPDIHQEQNMNTLDENVNVRYIKVGNTTVKLVEHFSGNQTYSDIIRDSLRRVFSK